MYWCSCLGRTGPMCWWPGEWRGDLPLCRNPEIHGLHSGSAHPMALEMASFFSKPVSRQPFHTHPPATILASGPAFTPAGLLCVAVLFLCSFTWVLWTCGSSWAPELSEGMHPVCRPGVACTHWVLAWYRKYGVGVANVGTQTKQTTVTKSAQHFPEQKLRDRGQNFVKSSKLHPNLGEIEIKE